MVLDARSDVPAMEHRPERARSCAWGLLAFITVDHQMIDAVEKGRGKQRPIPNASEAIRKLVEIGLASAHRAVLRTKKATDASEWRARKLTAWVIRQERTKNGSSEREDLSRGLKSFEIFDARNDDTHGVPSKPSRYSANTRLNARSRPIYDRSDETLAITVTSLFPHFVDAQQSAMRGLNIGWYAIDQDGEIASGPYRGRNECVIGIGQSPNGAPALWSRP